MACSAAFCAARGPFHGLRMARQRNGQLKRNWPPRCARRAALGSLSSWERAGVRARTALVLLAAQAPTPTLPNGGGGRHFGPPFCALRVAHQRRGQLRCPPPPSTVDQEQSGAAPCGARRNDLKAANVAGGLHPDTANCPIGGAVMSEPVWCVGVESAGRKRGLLAHGPARRLLATPRSGFKQEGAPLRRRPMESSGRRRPSQQNPQGGSARPSRPMALRPRRHW